MTEIHKRLHEINTFQCVDNELYLRGKDEMGESKQLYLTRQEQSLPLVRNNLMKAEKTM